MCSVQVMEEVLQTVDFDHFTTKELASDVRKSGLYHPDKIIERMEQLYEIQNYEFETLHALVTDYIQLRIEKDQKMKLIEELSRESRELSRLIPEKTHSFN